jgi:hypothetical protein
MFRRKALKDIPKGCFPADVDVFQPQSENFEGLLQASIQAFHWAKNEGPFSPDSEEHATEVSHSPGARPRAQIRGLFAFGRSTREGGSKKYYFFSTSPFDTFRLWSVTS